MANRFNRLDSLTSMQSQNIFSFRFLFTGGMLSVSFFGQGIGMSIGQSSLVVSGLWGIFYFKEVVRSSKIVSWFASAIITIAGVYVLCREHKDS